MEDYPEFEKHVFGGLLLVTVGLAALLFAGAALAGLFK